MEFKANGKKLVGFYLLAFLLSTAVLVAATPELILMFAPYSYEDPIPNPGHGGDIVWVDTTPGVSGGEMTLQDAIGAGLFGDMLPTCADGQIIEYNLGSDTWVCAEDDEGTGGVGVQFQNFQVFNSNGTFTVPAGVTKIMVEVWGAGGGGGGGRDALGSEGGGGGGGGGYCRGLMDVAPGQNIAAVVGNGGSGSTGNGGNGGLSRFSSFTATGGSGGDEADYVAGSGTPGAGGAGGTCSSTYGIGGNAGDSGGLAGGAGGTAGGGGGGGGAGGSYTGSSADSRGKVGNVPGGGGGGGDNYNGSGGNGAKGRVVVWW
jgi:hypothetical protein